MIGADMEGVDLREGSLANTSGGGGDLKTAHQNLTVADKGGANLAGAILTAQPGVPANSVSLKRFQCESTADPVR